MRSAPRIIRTACNRSTSCKRSWRPAGERHAAERYSEPNLFTAPGRSRRYGSPPSNAARGQTHESLGNSLAPPSLVIQPPHTMAKAPISRYYTIRFHMKWGRAVLLAIVSMFSFISATCLLILYALFTFSRLEFYGQYYYSTHTSVVIAPLTLFAIVLVGAIPIVFVYGMLFKENRRMLYAIISLSFALIAIGLLFAIKHLLGTL
jgi:hypothetical protein